MAEQEFRLTVEVSGFRELERLLVELPNAVQNRLGNLATLAGARVIAARARQLAPSSGRRRLKRGEVGIPRLKDSIVAKNAIVRRASLRGATVAVGGIVGPLAHLIEKGSLPHTIVPKKKTVLKFVFLGETRFFSIVAHPGAKKHPFLRPAFDEKSKDAIAKIAENLSGGIIREAQKPANVAKKVRENILAGR